MIIGLIDSLTKPGDDTGRPPLDVEADAIIRALFVRKPEAAYRVTMLALAQARELEERDKSSQGNWLARLLKKQDALARNKRRDPRLSISTQNSRGR